MRQSHLFSKTSKEFPSEEVAVNAKLLSRAGFIDKVMAGVWTYLPLGLRVLNKLNRVLREEMQAVGGQEISMTALQAKDLWDRTGRWNELKEVMYQFEDTSGRALGLAVTHEEPLAEVARKVISSYKDLPLYVYQIQTKFRNEPRAKSGLLRSREFLMKDLYSFDRNEKGLQHSYELLRRAYHKFFKRLGLNAKEVEASGGSFTKDFTHEFQVLTEAGEDEILYCASCNFAQNKEIASVKNGDACPKCKGRIEEGKSIEVGHIYKLGTKYSEALGLYYTDEEGKKNPVVMGSYGIGPGRVMGTIVEISHDASGIRWPEIVSPFQVHLIEVKSADLKVKKEAQTLYQTMLAKGVEVLYDDRDDKSAGEKFIDADLIGIVWRVVVSARTLEKKGIGVKKRSEEKEEVMTIGKFLEKIK